MLHKLLSPSPLRQFRNIREVTERMEIFEREPFRFNFSKGADKKKTIKVHIRANFRGCADKKWNVPTNRKSKTGSASLKEAKVNPE